MKRPRGPRTWLAGALVALVGCGGGEGDAGAFERSLESILATCAVASGEVKVKRKAHGFWEDLQVGEVLLPGDWVRTGPGASARIEYLGGTGLELDEDAMVIVEADDGGPATPDGPARRPSAVVSVTSGSVRGLLARKGGDAGLKVKTADGRQAQVEAGGTGPVELRVAGGEGTPTEIIVQRGEAKVALAGEEKVLGDGRAVALGATALEEVEVVGTPAPGKPAPDARVPLAAQLELTWEPVPGAARYRVQVAHDPTFRDLVKTEEVEGARLAFSPPSPGPYHWRVAARDTRGRAGEFAPPRRLFVEKAAPRDHLSAPAPGAQFGHAGTAPVIGFSWEPQEGASRYRLVVARSTDLTRDPVVSEVTDATAHEVGDLAPGTYHWGVYVQGEDGSPLFVAPRKLVIKSTGRDVKIPKRYGKWGE